MSWMEAQCRENLYAVENLLAGIAKKVSETADLLHAFVNQDGPQMDLAMRASPQFGLKSAPSIGCAKVLTKTDRLWLYDSRTTKNTACFYNYSPNQYVGNYKNWLVSTIISRIDTSGIIKIGPSHNLPELSA